MYAALISRIRQLVKNRTATGGWYTLVAVCSPCWCSRCQIPAPLLCQYHLSPVRCALQPTWVRATEKGSRAFRIIQNVIIALLLLLVAFLYRPDLSAAALLILPLGAWCCCSSCFRWLQANPEKSSFTARLAVAAVNSPVYQPDFYPDLLRYQSSSEAAFYVNRELPDERAVHAGSYAPVFEFYIRDPQFRADTIVYRHPDRYTPGVWYISDEEYDQVRQRNISPDHP